MDFFLRCTLRFLSGSTRGFPLWFRCRWVFQLGREATQERCLVYRLHLLSCSRNKCLLAARGRVRLREVPDVNWQAWRLKTPVPLATWWLHGPLKEKPRYFFDSGVFFTDLVPER